MKKLSERHTVPRLLTALLLAGLALGLGFALAPFTAVSGGSAHAAHLDALPNQVESGGDIDWSRPLVNAVTVSSIGAAERTLAFHPTAPPSVGKLVLQVTAPESASDLADRDLAVIYDNPALGGRFWVLESPAGAVTSAGLAQIAASCTPSHGCEATDTMTTLDNGSSALLIEGLTNGVIWVQGGVEYDVVGPADAFTSADAVSVADAIAKFAATP